MKRRAQAIFNDDGSMAIVTTKKGKRHSKKFYSVSQAVNYCAENRIEAYGKSSVSCPLKPSDSAPLKHSTMPP